MLRSTCLLIAAASLCVPSAAWAQARTRSIEKRVRFQVQDYDFGRSNNPIVQAMRDALQQPRNFVFVDDQFTVSGGASDIREVLGARFGGGINAHANGSLKVWAEWSGIQPPRVSITYPIDVTLTFPTQSSFRPGDWIYIDSASSTAETAQQIQMSTRSGFSRAGLFGRLGFGGGVSAELCKFGCDTHTLVPDFHAGPANFTILSIGPDPGETFLPFNLGTVIPKTINPLETVLTGIKGFIDMPEVLTQTGVRPDGRLVTSGEHHYQHLEFDLDKWPTKLAGLPPFGAAIPDVFNTGFSAKYEYVDYRLVLDHRRRESFEFTPEFFLRYDFPEPLAWEEWDGATLVASGTSTSVRIRLGNQLGLLFPAHRTTMDLDPVVEMDNTLSVDVDQEDTTQFRIKQLQFELNAPQFTVRQPVPRHCVPDCVDVPQVFQDLLGAGSRICSGQACLRWGSASICPPQEICTPAVPGVTAPQIGISAGPLVDVPVVTSTTPTQLTQTTVPVEFPSLAMETLPLGAEIAGLDAPFHFASVEPIGDGTFRVVGVTEVTNTGNVDLYALQADLSYAQNWPGATATMVDYSVEAFGIHTVDNPLNPHASVTLPLIGRKSATFDGAGDTGLLEDTGTCSFPRECRANCHCCAGHPVVDCNPGFSLECSCRNLPFGGRECFTPQGFPCQPGTLGVNCFERFNCTQTCCDPELDCDENECNNAHPGMGVRIRYELRVESATAGPFVNTLSLSGHTALGTVARKDSVPRSLELIGIRNLSVPASVNEGQAANLSFELPTPGSSAALTVEVRWGDGSVERTALPPGQTQFTRTHLYPDDTGVGPGSVALVAGTSELQRLPFTIAVNNVAPVVELHIDENARLEEARDIALTVIATDPAELDTLNHRWIFGRSATAVPSPGRDMGTQFTASPDDDGAWFAIVVVSDDDGGVFRHVEALQIENRAPVITDASIPELATEGSTLSFSADAFDPSPSDPVSLAWEVKLEGATVATGAGPNLSYFAADDGRYEVAVVASDGDGGVAELRREVVVVNLAPTTSLGALPSQVNEGAVLSLSATATDPSPADPLAVNWVLRKDGAPFTSFTGLSGAVPLLDEGLVEIGVVARDGDGGIDASTATVEVLNVAPVFELPPEISLLEGEQLAQSIPVSDPGDDSLSFTLDYGDGSTVAGALTTTLGLDHVYADDGVFTLTATVSDADGGATQKSSQVTVLNVAPAFELGASARIHEGVAFSRSLSFTDPGADSWSGSVDFGDGAGVQGLALSQRSFTLAHAWADDGVYAVKVTIADDGGGESTRTLEVTVDNVAPVLAIQGTPATALEGAQVDAVVAISDVAADTHSAQWAVLKNGVDFASGVHQNFSFTPDDDGDYQLRVNVVDDDGGSAQAQVSVRVSNVAPVAEISGASAGSAEGSAVSLSASASDAGAADTHSFAWEVRRGGAPVANGAGASFSFTPDDDGSYSVTLTVTDDDGASHNTSVGVDVVNVAPTFDLGPSVAVAEATPFQRTVDFVDPGNDQWIGSVDYGDGSGLQPLALSGRRFSLSHQWPDNGAYITKVTVGDDDGGESTVQLPTTITNLDPHVKVEITSGAGVEGGRVDALASVQDAPGDTHTVSWQVLKEGADFASGTSPTFSFTPDDNGRYLLRATALDDDGGSASGEVETTIENVAPAFELGAPVTMDEGSTFSRQIAFTDPGADSWSVTSSDGEGPPVTTALSARSFTLSRHYADDGAREIEVQVSDDDGGASIRRLEVNVVNVAPSLTLGPPVQAEEGVVFTRALSFSDPGADTWVAGVDYGDGGGVQPLALSGRDFLLSHAWPNNGDYSLSVHVRDDEGASASAQLQVSVANLAPRVGIQQVPASGLEGVRIEALASITDVPGDAHSVRWNVLKDGADFATGVHQSFAFTPDDDGRYTVRATVVDSDGGQGSAEVGVDISNQAPAVSIDGVPAQADENVAIELSAQIGDPGSADTHTASWRVDRQGALLAQGSGADFDFTPPDDGRYAVTLSVTDDDGGVAQAQVELDVDNVAPSLTPADATGFEGAPLFVDFAVSDAGEDLLNAQVRFGDGSPLGDIALAAGSRSLELEHRYLEDGVYTLSVELSDDSGARTSASGRVEIANVAPEVDAGPEERLAGIGGGLGFDGSFSDAGPFDTHVASWDFGDGSPEVLALSTSHAYAEAGVFTATLTVTDDDGGVGHDSVRVEVIDAPTEILSDCVPRVAAGGEYRYDARAAGESLAGARYEVTDGPAGIAIDPDLGVVSFDASGLLPGEDAAFTLAFEYLGARSEQSCLVSVIETLVPVLAGDDLDGALNGLSCPGGGNAALLLGCGFEHRGALVLSGNHSGCDEVELFAESCPENERPTLSGRVHIARDNVTLSGLRLARLPYGLEVHGGAVGVDNVAIVNNHIEGCAGAWQPALNLQGVRGGRIAGNLLRGCTYGIQIGQGARDLTIEDNTFYGVDSSLFFDAWARTQSSGLVVTGNRLWAGARGSFFYNPWGLPADFRSDDNRFISPGNGALLSWRPYARTLAQWQAATGLDGRSQRDTRGAGAYLSVDPTDPDFLILAP